MRSVSFGIVRPLQWCVHGRPRIDKFRLERIPEVVPLTGQSGDLREDGAVSCKDRGRCQSQNSGLRHGLRPPRIFPPDQPVRSDLLQTPAGALAAAPAIAPSSVTSHFPPTASILGITGHLRHCQPTVLPEASFSTCKFCMLPTSLTMQVNNGSANCVLTQHA